MHYLFEQSDVLNTPVECFVFVVIFDNAGIHTVNRYIGRRTIGYIIVEYFIYNDFTVG